MQSGQSALEIIQKIRWQNRNYIIRKEKRCVVRLWCIEHLEHLEHLEH